MSAFLVDKKTIDKILTQLDASVRIASTWTEKPDFDTSRYIFRDEQRSSLLNCKALRNCRLDTQPQCIDTWIMEIDLTGPSSFAYHCIHVSA